MACLAILILILLLLLLPLPLQARKHWEQPWASPLGNSNYHRESGWQDDSKRDSQFTQNQKKKWS